LPVPPFVDLPVVAPAVFTTRQQKKKNPHSFSTFLLVAPATPYPSIPRLFDIKSKFFPCSPIFRRVLRDLWTSFIRSDHFFVLHHSRDFSLPVGRGFSVLCGSCITPPIRRAGEPLCLITPEMTTAARSVACFSTASSADRAGRRYQFPRVTSIGRESAIMLNAALGPYSFHYAPARILLPLSALSNLNVSSMGSSPVWTRPAQGQEGFFFFF